MLTPKMLGEVDGHGIKTKGGENNCLVEFLCDVMDSKWNTITDPGTSPSDLKLAGDPLRGFIRCNKGQARKTTLEHTALVQELTAIHLEAAVRAKVKMTPKHHMMRHLAGEMAHKGSPAKYACWLDESINNLLTNIAASNHRLAMQRKTYMKFDLILEGTR